MPDRGQLEYDPAHASARRGLCQRHHHPCPPGGRFPCYDHGFLYGEGIYETLRTYNKVPFLYDRHMRRFRASAERLDLLVPFDDGTLAAWVDDTLAAAGDLREAYIRILLTRGVGDLSYDLGATPAPSLVIIVKPLDEVPARVDENGIVISLVPILRNHPGSVNPIIKSNNLLNNAMAMQRANRHGAEEALMCNYRGELAECAQTNFFLVRGGRLLTPPSTAGLLEGITRGFLFDLARDAGIEAREEVLRPEDLDTADEAFITGTTRELSPVVRIDERVIGSGRPGPITLDLLTRYRKYAWETTDGGDAFSVTPPTRSTQTVASGFSRAATTRLHECLDRRARADQVAVAIRVVDARNGRPELGLAQVRQRIGRLLPRIRMRP